MARIIIFTLTLLASLVVSQSVTAADKVAFCHATGSESNPYEFIETAPQAVINAHIDHQHTEDIIPEFTYDGVTYGPQGNQTILRAGCTVVVATATATSTIEPTPTNTNTPTETATVTPGITQTVITDCKDEVTSSYAVCETPTNSPTIGPEPSATATATQPPLFCTTENPCVATPTEEPKPTSTPKVRELPNTGSGQGGIGMSSLFTYIAFVCTVILAAVAARLRRA